MKNPLLVAWFLVIVFPNLLHAAPLCTWHVATSGRDASGCGTSGSPCATVAYVDTNIVPAGDTVCVASGTYTGSFQTSKNGTVSQRIRFISYPSQWGAILVGNTTGDGSAAWTSLGRYVDIVGFGVTAQSSSASPAIGILNDGKYDRILGNRVSDVPLWSEIVEDCGCGRLASGSHDTKGVAHAIEYLLTPFGRGAADGITRARSHRAPIQLDDRGAPTARS
jgi:hypothetical protein